MQLNNLNAGMFFLNLHIYLTFMIMNISILSPYFLLWYISALPNSFGPTNHHNPVRWAQVPLKNYILLNDIRSYM